jgi:hypothetical protein
MWWFIIYSIFSFLFFTVIYYYTYNEYPFPSGLLLWKKELIIVIVSILIGLFWPIFILLSLIHWIYKLKK